ncbi:Lsr2 family protein [Thermobispora bispora]|jgi:hypothetical protein|uniref:Lsr2 family protein n=1 Tax=Thermobispora bispora (strain ATCC 19993 / DSM 43833 / CBS 139.67 / JCM 10125 / KCTC 9307 / NBRC 14880 / R51) TaxID=469371 RepID=D6Y9S6_THEBD|nr:Lsr2 family protein [Thermobispora bispora]MBO2473156.1 Lsr2 family protein [Actinomycetales bacterium]MDI9580804.1 Lsr2 family protein [Thermobispora sp.]ADG90107.1 hypothetical protein Tbis_3417 [Thermobispora bispora DSM 43833]MBX6168737.1 Lsr2 family protein [Thermobispora bispora]QSI46552.1 Lsr2 family protein [Thermobispora bispora]
MAKHTQVILIDDLDGSEASQTVTFALDGTTYEIDLSDENAKKLRDALQPFVKCARRADTGQSRRRRSSQRSSTLSREKSAEIRAWAKAHGHRVSDRGRISREILEAYEAAH